MYGRHLFFRSLLIHRIWRCSAHHHRHRHHDMYGAALLHVPKPISCGSFFSKLSRSLRLSSLYFCACLIWLRCTYVMWKILSVVFSFNGVLKFQYLLLSHPLIFFRFLFYQLCIFIERVCVFLLLSMYVYSYCSSMYSYCFLCILIVVCVFLLFVHVFLSLSMYTYCCPCILRRGYPDWGFSVLFPRL